MASGQRLRVVGLRQMVFGFGVCEVGQALGKRFGKLEPKLGLARRVVAPNAQPQDHSGLLQQAPRHRVQARVFGRRQPVGRGVSFIGGAMLKLHADEGAGWPVLDHQAEVDARDGMLEAPVEHGFEQREQQRGIALHRGGGEHLAHLDAAGVNLAPAQAQHLAQQGGEVDPLTRQLHAAVAEAGDLLAHDAGAARQVDFLAQLAQAVAVDVAGCGERGHAFKGRRQGAGHLAAELGHQGLQVERLGAVLWR